VPAHDGVIHVDGAVDRPLELRVADQARRVTWTSTVTLECAGNGRGSLVPPAPGEQWGIGAVGTADWSGVPLADVLAEAAPRPDAVELVFAGTDRGMVGAVGRELTFERSLPLADVGQAYLVVAMNGEPLAPNHGAPVRLLVPGRYGMASVKWLNRITAVTAPFRGFFQADRYVIDGAPLGPIAPRAVIAAPAADTVVRAGEAVTIRGYAWAGRGPVGRVEVSTDGGASWADAALGPVAGATAWRSWSLAWRPATGDATLLARATDAAGDVQPLDQVRTDLGYGNNAAQPVRLRVDG
jgi:DMSO/TMAO reductase YedYZ molybdopterin-dependent catalytic subunit